MCDYSVVAARTRLAMVGEELIAHRFASGSIGFTSPRELENVPRRPSWRVWFTPPPDPCAVCIPPGAKLILWDLPVSLQSAAGVGSVEMVTMVQAAFLEGQHRDGILFRNHQQMLLQRLSAGQRATVLSLGGEDHEQRYEAHPPAEHVLV